jgi:hypothetical protein
MNKPAKPEAEDFDDLSDLYGGPPPTEAEWDAWWELNRDESSAVGRGGAGGNRAAHAWDPEEIMAEVREQLRKEGH